MRLQRQSNNQIITLDVSSTVGHGGEARIYAVLEDESLVAKVYHKPTKAYEYKLKAMLVNPPENPTAGKGHISIAWPIDLLRTGEKGDRVVGFLMPRVQEMHSMLDFYNPKTRRQKCPFFNYLYLHRTARNLAAAVGALHARGYCVGDVNESNILVGNTALVTLVDTDSFQVRDPDNKGVYRCPVGKSEFTPPELQGKNFALAERTTEHDLFGLGVLIFQLLMEGTHPFSGIYQGTGDPPPYEARIAAGHFAYSTGRSVPYIPTLIAPPFEILHPNLRQLFVQCFENGHKNPKMRPTAQDWQTALKKAEAALITCSTNSQHRYGNHLQTCPWCERTIKLGSRDPFPSAQVVKEGKHLQPLKRKTVTIPQRSDRLLIPSTLTLAKQKQTLNKTSRNKTKWVKPLIWGLSSAAVLIVLEIMVIVSDLKLPSQISANFLPASDKSTSREPLVDSGDAAFFYNQGNSYYRLGDYRAAIENYNQALKLNPKSAKAYLMRGNAHYEIGQNSGARDREYKAAIGDYNKALRISPQESEAYLKRGIIRYHFAIYSTDPDRDYKAAINDFNHAVRINPDNAKAYVKRGIVKYQFVQYSPDPNQAYSKVINDFNEAIRINPQEAEAYLKRGNVHYEIAQYSTNSNTDYQKAADDLQKAAKLYFEKGDIEEYQKAQIDLCNVLKDLEKSCDSFPSSSETTIP